MIGKCPNCGIEFNKPPFNNRNRNEVLIVLIYREKIESNIKLKSIEELGYCEICDAKLEDLEKQEKLINNQKNKIFF